MGSRLLPALQNAEDSGLPRGPSSTCASARLWEAARRPGYGRTG
jgi:hypothetical protein